jgi:hypothetical protein
LVASGGKAGIPATTSSTSTYNEALIWFNKIPQEQPRALLADDGAWGNKDDHILT